LATIIRNYSELLAALRRRCDELDVSHETVDAVAGIPAGYFSKLVSTKPMKHIGPISWVVLEALGLRVIVEDDPEALKRSRRKRAWQGRKLKPWWSGDRVRPSAAERNGSAEPADSEDKAA
jgi:hypothetical protein